MSPRQAATESAALVVPLVEPSATTARSAKVRVALLPGILGPLWVASASVSAVEYYMLTVVLSSSAPAPC
jgi:hypothetical protein